MTITMRSSRLIKNTFFSRKQEIVSRTTSGIPRFYYVRTQSFSVSHGENIVGDDSVYVVWNDDTTGNRDLFFTHAN
jgi:hypothetical protein